jgi:hypothetical protein
MPDPHQSEKPDPDLHQSKKPGYFGAVEAPNKAKGGSPWNLRRFEAPDTPKRKTYLDLHQSLKSNTYR